jgi:hypothetical protein
MNNTPDPLKDPRFEEMLSRLRGQAVPEPSAGFCERTLAGLRQQTAGRKVPLILPLRVAAAIALLLGAGVWMLHPAKVAPDPTPIDILMSAQRADGGWSADAQNLRPRYDTGVTALVLLALMHADPAALEGPQSGAIRAGMEHLLRQQSPDGRFGADFSGTGFTQYLAGMAIQAAAKLSGADPAWHAAALQVEPHLPSEIQMAKLNSGLAHPNAFPARWADAGGDVTLAAIQILGR